MDNIFYLYNLIYVLASIIIDCVLKKIVEESAVRTF